MDQQKPHHTQPCVHPLPTFSCRYRWVSSRNWGFAEPTVILKILNGTLKNPVQLAVPAPGRRHLCCQAVARGPGAAWGCAIQKPTPGEAPARTVPDGRFASSSPGVEGKRFQQRGNTIWLHQHKPAAASCKCYRTAGAAQRWLTGSCLDRINASSWVLLGTLCFYIFLSVRIRNEHHRAANPAAGMGVWAGGTVCSWRRLASGLASKGSAGCLARLPGAEILLVHMTRALIQENISFFPRVGMQEFSVLCWMHLSWGQGTLPMAAQRLRCSEDNHPARPHALHSPGVMPATHFPKASAPACSQVVTSWCRPPLLTAAHGDPELWAHWSTNEDLNSPGAEQTAETGRADTGLSQRRRNTSLCAAFSRCHITEGWRWHHNSHLEGTTAGQYLYILWLDVPFYPHLILHVVITQLGWDLPFPASGSQPWALCLLHSQRAGTFRAGTRLSHLLI